MDKLRGAGQDLLKALGEKATGVRHRRAGRRLTDKLEDIADGGPIGKAVAKGGEAKAEGRVPGQGGAQGCRRPGSRTRSPAAAAARAARPRPPSPPTSSRRSTSACPITVAYNQWTQFGAFPSFMKKVENVEAQDDEQDHLQGPDLLVAPHLGGDDPRADPGRADRLAVEGRRRATSTARSPSTSSART